MTACERCTHPEHKGRCGLALNDGVWCGCSTPIHPVIDRTTKTPKKFRELMSIIINCGWGG